VQSFKAKPSLLPYAVMLAIFLVNLAFDAISIYRLFHMPTLSDDEAVVQRVLYIMLGSRFGAMVLSMATGAACTQWLMERRRVPVMPGYTAMCIGVAYALFSVVLNLLWWFITQAITKSLSGVALHMMVVVNVIAGLLLTVLCAILPVLLVFRLLRKHEKPAVLSVELRPRALLIFTLFVWSWVLVAMQFAVPAAASLGAAYGVDSGLLPLAAYAGSIMLVLPAFLGALFGLPGTMPSARPLRLWIASLAASVACALAMVLLTNAMLRIGKAMLDDFEPTQGFAALVALVWFVVSVLLCGLLVRVLVRRSSSSMPVGKLELSQ
jgi:MFS family permease